MVGAAGFELAASRSQSERTTRLCYAPSFIEETIPSVGFYRRKLRRSSQTAIKSSKNRIINAEARARWLISRFISSGSSPKVILKPSGSKIGS